VCKGGININDLSLIKSENFNTVQCDFYQNENKDILITRKQIGEALGYNEPQKSIDKLHERHRDRLDKFSVTVNLVATDGKEYPTMVYTAKGVYEICRWSRQPKADAFMDWVWNIVEAIRTGQYSVFNDNNKLNYMKEVNKTLRLIQDKKTRDSIARQLLTQIFDISVPEITSKDYKSVQPNAQVKDFITTQCERVEGTKIKKSLMFDTYKAWCLLNDLEAVTKYMLGKYLRLMGIEEVAIHGHRYWKDITLKN
jgi:prophage antirepressor-like protein